MQRRAFLGSFALLATLPLAVRAEGNALTIGIYPGTGKADIATDAFLAAARSFGHALATPLGLEPSLILFRSIKNTTRSIEKGRMDVYFIPPSVAVTALDNNYSPVARVRDQASGMLIRRKGAEIRKVALTEKESWLDVMGRYTLKRNKPGVEMLNLKTQEDVALAIEQDLVQAGSLRSSAANKLIEKGNFEVWYPLPATPDFTIVANNQLGETRKDKLGAAAAALTPAAIESLQKTIHSKVTGFVVDKQADYKIIKLALSEAGYLD